MKRCSKCGETKPRREFHKNRTRKDGLQHRCKSCGHASARRRRERLRADGICTECGKKEIAPRSNWSCYDCLAKRCESAQRRRERLRADGICTDCNKEEIFTPMSDWHCYDCLAKRCKADRRRAGWYDEGEMATDEEMVKFRTAYSAIVHGTPEREESHE